MMTNEQLQLVTPAAFAESPIPDVSDQYTFIPTTQLIEDFAQLGWGVERARQQRSRKHPLHTKHMLIFRSPKFPAMNGLHIEIITVNSHDRSASFNFMIGLFRYACVNGLIVSDKIFESFRIRHIHYNFDEVKLLLNTMVENMPRVMAWVDKLQSVNMTPDQQREFAIKAVACRFKEYVNDEGVVNVPMIEKAIDIDQLLQAQREEDDNASIWAVYNRVQEKLMKGGFKRLSQKDNIFRSTRGITNIKLDVEMNKALWQLANEYLPN